MAEGKKGYATCKMLLLQQSLFVYVEFDGDCPKAEVNLITIGFEDISRFESVMFVNECFFPVSSSMTAVLPC